jgi:hypothetical protein
MSALSRSLTSRLIVLFWKSQVMLSKVAGQVLNQ